MQDEKWGSRIFRPVLFDNSSEPSFIVFDILSCFFDTLRSPYVNSSLVTLRRKRLGGVLFSIFALYVGRSF
jgi:hypothetical protein